MKEMGDRLAAVRAEINRAGNGRGVDLVAVSKLQPAAAIQALAALGQRHFGENYVQEALAKQRELDRSDLQWHLIGPLQSNKCRDVARHFDWVQTVDRAKLVPLLARERPPERAPLNVLIQVNIGDETSKSGCAPNEIAALAGMIGAEPRLRLRGLMAIPAPWPDPTRRRQDFAAMHALFLEFRAQYRQVDTLSMGMSDDFALAIGEGATMVRIGSALFGARASSPHHL
jgi:PLP dependent protein